MENAHFCSWVGVHSHHSAEGPRGTESHSSKAEIYSLYVLFDCVDHNKLWKILKEMGIPDHLICLLRNLYAGQEATVRTGYGTTDWFQIGKGVCVYCHPAYLTSMQSTS